MAFANLAEFCDSNASLIKSSPGKFYGNALPASYAKLGHLGSKVRIYEALTLEAEINWTLLTIRKHRWEISLFLEYRALFEKAFLLGDYLTAEKYLEKIEKEVCYSLWSLQNRFLLLEHMQSPEAQKAFLSDMNNTATGFFIPYLAHFFSNRAEKNLAISRFDFDIKDGLQKLKGKNGAGNREFYYWRLNRFDLVNYSNLKDVLTYDGYHSAIDRYNTLKFVLKKAVTSDLVSNETKMFITQRLRYLVKKFQDPELLTLYKLLYMDFESFNSTDFDLKICDLFTAGLYQDCIKSLERELQNDPSNALYYVLYVKSILLSGLPFNLPASSNCFQYKIMRAIYDQLNRAIAPSEASINLQRIIKNIDGFSLADGIFKFLNDEVLGHSNWQAYNLLSYSYNVPEISSFFKETELSKFYMKQVAELYPSSISIELNLAKLEEGYTETILHLGIPEVVKQIETAKYYSDQKNYSHAKDIWLWIIQNSTDIIPILQIAVENLFDCYVGLSQYDEAIKLYVDNYIEKSYLVYRISVVQIHAQIRKNKFKQVAPVIELPLFYTFSNGDENEAHIAYEKFNRAISVTRPSELNAAHFSGDLMKWVLYLHQTCTTEIFKHSIFIDGSKDGYTERIAVCRNLIALDSENEAIYKREITDLSDLLIIQEGLQQLDESKIYVNESGLINSELKEFEGLYNRFKTIANLYKQSNKSLVIYDKRRGARLASMEDVENELFKVNYSNDPLRDAFADIFDVITRRFLFSKFGISAYLSTRIRHGVLLGEIRPVFEKFNLIAQKDTNTGKYVDIEHWNARYPDLSLEKSKKLHAAFAAFSKKIDDIIQELLKEKLQIRMDDENVDGWFNYYFEDNTLSLYAINVSDAKDFSDFVKKVIEILWYRTDTNLEQIRSEISNEVRARFNEKIAVLTSDLQAIPLTVSDIFTNINTCSTEIQNVIDRIAGWFNRSGSQTSDFKLDKLITIVFENVSHSYTKRHLVITRFEVAELMIKGEFYMHFADLFRIFFDNALKHSDQLVESINTEVIVEIIGDELKCSIKNNHPDGSSLSEIVDHSNSDLNMKKLSTEGKSGFPKADKIIRSDLKNEANSYKVFEDEQNNFTVNLNISIENLRA